MALKRLPTEVLSNYIVGIFLLMDSDLLHPVFHFSDSSFQDLWSRGPLLSLSLPSLLVALFYGQCAKYENAG